MNYLVPYDFTPITRSALDHALSIRKMLSGKIELLHIIAKEDERAQAERKLNEVLASLSVDEREGVSSRVHQGDIFKDITQEAEKGGFQLLVMGTHGAKGLQKLLGSKAIKVITSGYTPFIITQAKGPSAAIKRIVLPVDLSRESIQIVEFSSNLAKRFGAEIHIVCEPQTDEWLVKKVRNNITLAKRQLDKQGAQYKVSTLAGKKAFSKEVIDYGDKQMADMFAVAYFTESILPQFDTFAQEMITNALQLPVLIMNAEPASHINSKYSFLTI